MSEGLKCENLSQKLAEFEQKVLEVNLIYDGLKYQNCNGMLIELEHETVEVKP